MTDVLPSAPGAGSATAQNKRSGQRIRTVCRLAKVLRVDDAGLWLVRNISDGGMMLSTQVDVQPGEAITIALSDTVQIDARVAWVKDGQCGVAFVENIDGSALLRQLAQEQRDANYRPPRIPVTGIGRVMMREGWQPIELTNLSQQGAGFTHDGTVKVGAQLDLLLGNIMRKAIVRWTRGERGGLWLTQPLNRSDLESIRALGDMEMPQMSSQSRR